jgi:hypothetical protein
MLAAMDFDQLTSDLSGLTQMAEASRVRLAELAGRVTAVQEQMQKLLADAEPSEPPAETLSDDA